MSANPRQILLLICLCLCLSPAFPQQVAEDVSVYPQSIHLIVHAAPKNGPEATGLQARSFTVQDNHVPAPIVSFKAVTAEQEPVKVILLLDAVNIDFSRVAYAREQVQRFLKENNGALANPTTIAVLTDRGTQIQKGFPQDGNALSSSLGGYTVGLREINRSSGIWGVDERVDDSLRAERELLGYGASLPGRKIVIWISPGWPLLAGPGVLLSSKQQTQIFANVVAFSNELQQATVTLYSVNPLGVDETIFHEDYYQAFLKGVAKSSQTDLADLSLQVLAVQSGGLALNGSNDVARGLQTCVGDLQSWYEVTIAAAKADQPNEYHHIDVHTDQPGVISRTRDGYYAQP